MCKDVHCSTACRRVNCKQQKKNSEMNIQHILGKPHSFIHFSFIHSLTAVFQFKVVHIMIYLYNHEKHVHNGKMLMNIKRKGWDTRFCVCKSKIKSYVILPLFNMYRRKGNSSKH